MDPVCSPPGSSHRADATAPESPTAPAGADAHPWAGFWRFVVDLPDGTKCNNDGVLPGTVTFKVDALRQEGTFATTDPAPWCPWGLAPGYMHPVYFTLTRI